MENILYCNYMISKEMKICDSYVNGNRVCDILTEFKISSRKLCEILRLNNIVLRLDRINNCKNSIVEFYKNGISSNKISELLNVGKATIFRCLNKANVKIKDRFECQHRIKVNDDYFVCLSKENAYWIGFIAADGCVSSKNNTLKISLHNRDIDVLEKFKRDISFEGDIKNYGNYCEIRIRSNEIVRDLGRFGIVSNKTFIGTKMINEFKSHFIRGYFDGDGSVYIDKDNTLHFDICSYVPGILNEIQNVFISEMGLNKTKMRLIKNTSDLRYGGNINCRKIYEYMYKDCEDRYLKRKKEKFELVLYRN